MEFKTRIAGIVIQDEKILMLQGHGLKDLWTPGGKIDEGETDEECLKRELKEEIGVELTSSKFFKEYTSDSFYHPGRIINSRIYIININGEIKTDAEIDSYVWLTKQDFETKKYSMIPNHRDKLIPDLIKAGIW